MSPDLLERNEANAEQLHVSGEDSAWNGSGRISPIPFTMPTLQMYYWQFAWQRDERETLAGLENGEYVDFDSDDPEDAARWLREPDDDE